MTMTMTKTLENISNWRPYELVTFQTFDQSDEKTWPDQPKKSGKDKPTTRTMTCELQ